jgi:hypothetical protein
VSPEQITALGLAIVGVIGAATKAYLALRSQVAEVRTLVNHRLDDALTQVAGLRALLIARAEPGAGPDEDLEAIVSPQLPPRSRRPEPPR